LLLGFGVEEFGEAGVVGYAVEVGVKAGLETVLIVEADGLGEVFDASVVVAGHAVKESEAVKGVVGGFFFEEDVLKMLAGVVIIAVVEQRDGVVVALFVGLEGCGAFVNLRDAGRDVHTDAIGEVLWCGLEHFGEGFVGLLIFAGLHELERGLIERERGFASGIVGVLGIAGESARGLGGRGIGCGVRCCRLRGHGCSRGRRLCVSEFYR
jgi:hypothetical protein